MVQNVFHGYYEMPKTRHHDETLWIQPALALNPVRPKGYAKDWPFLCIVVHSFWGSSVTYSESVFIQLCLCYHCWQFKFVFCGQIASELILFLIFCLLRNVESVNGLYLYCLFAHFLIPLVICAGIFFSHVERIACVHFYPPYCPP